MSVRWCHERLCKQTLQACLPSSRVRAVLMERGRSTAADPCSRQCAHRVTGLAGTSQGG